MHNKSKICKDLEKTKINKEKARELFQMQFYKIISLTPKINYLMKKIIKIFIEKLLWMKDKDSINF